MNAHYAILDKLKDLYGAREEIQTVTRGGIDDVDLKKQTLFPLCHIVIGDSTYDGKVINFNVTVFCMDIVDIRKESTTQMDDTEFRGIDNEDDVLNSMLAAHMNVTDELRRGDTTEDKIQLIGDVSIEPFVERFENNLAGQTATYNVILYPGMLLC